MAILGNSLQAIRNSRNVTLLKFSPLGFAIGGMLMRLSLQSVQSRFQIALVWILALTLELIVSASLGRRMSSLRLVLNGTAASLAIVVTKWSLEGFPLTSYRDKILALVVLFLAPLFN